MHSLGTARTNCYSHGTFLSKMPVFSKDAIRWLTFLSWQRTQKEMSSSLCAFAGRARVGPSFLLKTAGLTSLWPSGSPNPPPCSVPCPHPFPPLLTLVAPCSFQPSYMLFPPPWTTFSLFSLGQALGLPWVSVVVSHLRFSPISLLDAFMGHGTITALTTACGQIFLGELMCAVPALPTGLCAPRGHRICLFCSLLCPQSLGQCLASSRRSPNVCWMNEPRNERNPRNSESPTPILVERGPRVPVPLSLWSVGFSDPRATLWLSRAHSP